MPYTVGRYNSLTAPQVLNLCLDRSMECMKRALWDKHQIGPTAASNLSILVSPRIKKALKSQTAFMGIPIKVDNRFEFFDALSNNFSPQFLDVECSVGDQRLCVREMVSPWLIDYLTPFRGLTIIVKSRAVLPDRFEKNELCALGTLREMISEWDYRKYLRYGFILVEGASGKLYQIYRGHHRVRVWSDGACIEEICVTIPDSKIPETDKVIAFKVAIEASEEAFRSLGNVFPMMKNQAA